MKTKPEKYTEEFVSTELAAMLSELKENETVVILGELFNNRDYSPQRFSEWEEKFKDNPEISESIKRIKSLLETRLNSGGLRGKLNPTMTIFNLKNNYGWKDKTEQDLNVKELPKPLLGGNSVQTDELNSQDTSA
jgi:hypothetical protein